MMRKLFLLVVVLVCFATGRAVESSFSIDLSGKNIPDGVDLVFLSDEVFYSNYFAKSKIVEAVQVFNCDARTTVPAVGYKKDYYPYGWMILDFKEDYRRFVTSVELTVTKVNAAMSLWVNDAVPQRLAKSSKEAVYTFDINSECSYLAICASDSYAMISKIKVYCDDEAGGAAATPELTWFDGHGITGQVTVNPNSAITVRANGADHILVSINGSAPVTFAGCKTQLFVIESTDYSVVGVNAEGEQSHPATLSVKVDRETAHAGVMLNRLKSTSELVPGGMYTIGTLDNMLTGVLTGTQDNGSVHFETYKDRFPYKGDMAVFDAEPVDDGKYLLRLHGRSEGGLGVDADGNLSYGEALPVTIKITKDSQGEYPAEIAFNNGSYLSYDTNHFIAGAKVSYSTYIYRVEDPVSNLAIVTEPVMTTQTVEIDGVPHLMRQIEVDVDLAEGVDSYRVYCGGIDMGTYSDRRLSLDAPAIGRAQLHIVPMTGTTAGAAADIDIAPWGDLESVGARQIDGIKYLYHNTAAQKLFVRLPLAIDDTVHPAYGLELTCQSHPEARIEQSEGNYYLVIDNYMDGVSDPSKIDERDFTEISYIVAPLFAIATPATVMSRAAAYTTATLRGAATSYSFTPVIEMLSTFPDIEATPADNAEATYYTIDGCHLSGTPTAPGLYIRHTATSTTKLHLR